MKFKDLLEKKKCTGYELAKNARIPYSTINDLINGRTIVQNISLKHALAISDYLDIDIRELNKLENNVPIDFRYFRNNLLSDLKRNDPVALANKIIKDKEIDYYYKNNAKAYAYYLLALIDFIFRKHNLPVFNKRYNTLRQEKLDKPFFIGSKIVSFETIEEAEEKLGIQVLPEFRRFNIIEEDVMNVA